MTLDKAIEGAFGRTEYIRREAWPNGSVGVINCLSENLFEPFWCTIGRVRYTSPQPGVDDLGAIDWHPCDINGKSPTGSWKGVFSPANDQESGSVKRGEQCEVSLDGTDVDGGCTLAWVKPHELSVRVPRDRIATWPDDGMVRPLRRLSIGANGLMREFHLLEIKWQPLQDGSRLYRLCVAERSQAH